MRSVQTVNIKKRVDATDNDETNLLITKHLRLLSSIEMPVRLETFSPDTNAETQVIDLVMLLRLCEVVQRCAVAIGHVDIMHAT